MPQTTLQQKIERKVLPFDLKEVDLQGSTFTGFSAAMGNVDLGNDVIEPGSFAKTIAERVSKRYIKLLDNHSSFSTKDVWGTVVAAEEVRWNGKGENAPTHKLLTTFEVSKADPDAQVALQKVAEGHLDQLSIGYRPLRVEYEVDEGVDMEPEWAWIMGSGKRYIKEIQWWETSLVIWAMNPEAQILTESLDSLRTFAQKAVESGEVSLDTIRDTMLAVKTATSCMGGGREDVRRAVDEVRKALGTLDAKLTPDLDDAADQLNALATRYFREHGEVGHEKFVSWVVDNLEIEAVEPEEGKTLTSARRPTFDGTESGTWSKPTLADYKAGLDLPSDAQWGDLTSAQRNKIAAHTLIGEGSADTFDEANSFPVVNPRTYKLNENAVDAANSRAPQASISSATAESIQAMCRTLLREEFDRDVEASADVTDVEGKNDDVPEPETPAEDVEQDGAATLAATVRGLKESVDKLAKTLDAGAEADGGVDPDGTASDPADHVEDQDAAKRTDSEEDGRVEHLLDGDELALVQEELAVLATALALTA